MTIAKRLLVLIALAVAGIIAVSAFSQIQTAHVFNAANYGNDNSVPSLIELDKINKYFSTQRVRGYRHILATTPEKMAAHEAKITEVREKLAATLKNYEGLVSDDTEKKLLGEVIELSTQYNGMQDRMLAFSKRGEKQQAESFAETDMFPVGEAMGKKLDEQIAYNEKLGKNGATEALAAKESARNWAIGITLVIAIAAIVLGLSISRGITQPLAEVVAVAGRVAQGNLGVNISPATGSDEVSQLKQSIQSMVQQLRQTVTEIVHESDEISRYAASLSSAAQQVSVSTGKQAQSTAAAAAAVEELTVSIDHVGSSADDASQRANEADGMAVSGNQELTNAAKQIADVAARVEASAQDIHTLSDQVQKIGAVTTVIREVADQTNLLALNAAIEAARAGEQGRGFAVVADEVRKLAERTTQSVQEITVMITAIQAGATGAVNSMQSSRQMVNEIVVLATDTSKTMGSIRTSTEVVQGAIGAISDALKEQRSASTELAGNVETIAQMSEENSSAVESVASSAEHLLSVADKLKSSIHRFSF